MCERRPAATVTDPCGRHTKVKCWHIKRWRSGGLGVWRSGGLNSAPLCHSSFPGRPVASHYHTPSANFYTKSRSHSALENSSGITDGQICRMLKLWCAGRTLCGFFLSFSALSLSFLEIRPVQQLPLVVWLEMIGFIPWWEFSVGQVLPWDPSQPENLPLYTL